MSLHVFFGTGDNEPFKDWLRANREDGYYLNVASGVIHAAACTHVWSVNIDMREHTSTEKVAGLSVGELIAYAKSRTISLSRCDKEICPLISEEALKG